MGDAAIGSMETTRTVRASNYLRMNPLITDEQFSIAAKEICRGELVAFPTETVYGLGANALDSQAVARVFELKGRPTFDPLIVHVADPQQLESLVTEVPDPICRLVEKFWPGPLSVVLQKKSIIPDLVTSGLDSVAIRCPGHPVARELIKRSGVPIAAPSANRFGCVSPTTAEHVWEQFGDQLPTILDSGPCEVGIESTVVGFDGVSMILYRPGGVPLEALEEEVGFFKRAGTDDKSPSSPGQLTQHYAPRTPLIISCDIPVEFAGKRVGVIALCPEAEDKPMKECLAVEFLSKSGCLREAASNLFAAMRRLDSAGLDGIIVRPVPEADLGLAIMDRLRRASAR